MLPTSIAGSISIVPPPGAVSPASTVRTSSSSKAKSRPGLDAAQVRVGLVGAGDVGVAGDRRVLDRSGTFAPTGPMKPTGPSSAAISSSRAWRKSAPSALRSLISLRRWSPRTRTSTMPRPSTITGSALMKAPLGSPRCGGHLLDPGEAGGLHSLRRAQRRRQLDRLRLGAGDLDVGGVAGGQRHLVLAGRAGRHVLVGAGAAHHPDVGLDPVPAHPAAVEDALVGAGLQLVGAGQALLVAVEGVGVLHRELAGAQDAGPRAAARRAPWSGCGRASAAGRGRSAPRGRRGTSPPPRGSSPAPSASPCGPRA